MVSKKIESLTVDELSYIEKILGKELAKEMDQDKTWQNKHGYGRPFEKQRRILNCMNAIRAQRDLKNKLSIKW